GRIFFKGEEIKGPGPGRAMIFQIPTLYPWLTVSQNIEFGLKIKGYDKMKRNQIAMEYLSLVKLRHFANSRPHELSMGMKQKVELARALALNADVLLMDEPFGVLDTLSRNKLQDELLRIWLHTKKLWYLSPITCRKQCIWEIG
ncbi:MAG: nitrate ABC transporter ATP-binding protein, partial [Deltaproteobacteria bacterium]